MLIRLVLDGVALGFGGVIVGASGVNWTLLTGLCGGG